MFGIDSVGKYSVKNMTIPKLPISKPWMSYFQTLSVKKYSVQNWIFIDWKVAYTPPEEGVGASGGSGCFGTCIVYPYDIWYDIMNTLKMYGVSVEICSEIVSCPYKCPKRRLRWRLLKHEMRKSLKTGLLLKCSYF